MKNRILVLFLLCCGYVHSQEFAQIKSESEEPIRLDKVKVDVEIVSDIAITTVDMQFYNPNNRVLEGEFVLPLGQGQSVTRFALDINGKLREAVVVEKEKARVAFETTVRRKIDPALLEVSKGNVYKARVYPIPSKGYKRVVIAFKQKLANRDDAYFYQMLNIFKDELKTFSFNMSVSGENKPIYDKTELSKFLFDKINNTYYSNYSKNGYKPNKIIVKIPKQKSQEELVFYDDYFYLKKQLNVEFRKNKKLKKVAIFWDNSGSQEYKKKEQELALLASFFKDNPKVKVDLIVFNSSMDFRKKFKIRNSDWTALKIELQGIIYDGASSFEVLKSAKVKADKILLFTDGLNTLSNPVLDINKQVCVINSSAIANHKYLENLAQLNGGKYINLSRISLKQGEEELKTQPLLFLGTNIKNAEVYPKSGTVVNANFSLSGKGEVSGKEVKLYFGYRKDKIIETIKLTFSKKQKLKSPIVKNIWIRDKINYLLRDKENNKNAIISLSKKHQVISPFTSMLILDRVEDYVTHEIEPPAELLKEYKHLMGRKRDNSKQKYTNAIEGLENGYERYFGWYDKKIISKQIKVAKRKSIRTTAIPARISSDYPVINSESTVRNKIVTGFVYSEYLEPFIDVNVAIKGASKKVKTDSDGKFDIDVAINDILVFGSDGFYTEEIKILSNTNSLSLILKEDSQLDELVMSASRIPSRSVSDNAVPEVAVERMEVSEDEEVIEASPNDNLEEVVIVGSAPVRKEPIAGSVQMIKADALERAPSSNVSQALQGRVAGVSENKDSSPNSIKRKKSTKIQHVKKEHLGSKIYIVDGLEVKQKPAFRASEISELYFMNSKQGQQLYGKRGAEGVAVYITKLGYRKSQDAIRRFERMVEDKVEFKGWNPDTPYIKELEVVSDSKLFTAYLKIKKNYKNSPSFFIDVADLFYKKGKKDLALRVLSNVVESDIDNYELLRSLAYKFEEFGAFDKAVFVYQEILKLRPEDIQSYRDLALAYEKNGEYQKALDELYKIVGGELVVKDYGRRYRGVENIAMIEMNRSISVYKRKLNTSIIEPKFIKNMPMDMRVVIDWNHNDTDIDLWIIDPNNEKCYYSHKKTKIGGKMSDDMTSGFGPEQFVLKRAIKGNYQIKAKYYGNSKQKLSGPTFLKVTTFKYYGTKKQEQNIKLVRLANKKDIIDLGKLIYK